MGASSSKVGRNTANISVRRYPTRGSRPSDATSSPSSLTQAKRTQQSGDQAADGRTSAIDIDGRDPQLAASLQRIGPAQPHPTFSKSSTSGQAATASASAIPQSATLQALQARKGIQEAVEVEKTSVYGRGDTGREFLDIPTLHKIIALRDERGMPSQEIEQLLNLKNGVVDRLGAKGVVQTA